MGFEIALFVVLVIGALVFILGPSLARVQAGPSRRGEVARLRKDKEAALLLLRDLDFDYRTGKILEGDYQASRTEAERKAVEVLAELDALEKPTDAPR